ncbi:hypothetical protein CPB84DRAFT_1843046 [Gymnopilus junonius]|uniref:F-box domain-containing protein n=1 Tax=Gymnopilus junonius TaxID=109634 RepID=A0A9P5NUK1_GYMJU|nr:hypothetical protein CPB84DRAFT_1843046 [Gymnopilus junonius]
MRRAYDILKSLSDKRSNLVKEKVNGLHDQLTLHLPVELISQIFTVFVHGSEDPFLHDYRSEFVKAQCSVPFTLSAVCKSWRQIAFKTPPLWSTVNIYVYSESKLSLQGELLRQWLNRSGQLPLEVFLLYAKSRYEDGIDFNIAFSMLDSLKALFIALAPLTSLIPLTILSRNFDESQPPPLAKISRTVY